MNPVIILALLIASTLDWKYRKIPNALTFSMILCGFIFQISSSGADGFFQALFGTCLGLVLLFIPFSAGGVGGGDVKLLAAIGSFVGPVLVIHVFLASAVFGGFFSLVEAIRHRTVKHVFHGILCRIQHVIFLQRLAVEDHQNSTAKALFIPYAISLSLGYVWVSLFGGVVPWVP